MGLCKSCAAFFCVTPFIPFSKKTPTAKTPSSFICLFTYLGYLFVVPLVSDFLSNCPTHELCVYTKTRWCCERQRVSITSLTLSKDVFCGKALLQLSGITGDAGARGAGDAEPWLGWKWKWWNFPKKIALPCFGGCLDMLLCWNSPQAEHSIPVGGISHLFPHATAIPHLVREKFHLEAQIKRQINLAAFFPHLQPQSGR